MPLTRVRRWLTGRGAWKAVKELLPVPLERRSQVLAADYPFLDVVWTMFIFFAWIIWFWLLITVFADIFRRRDTSGFAKVLWIIFVIVLPFLGVFIYLIANHEGMTERNIQREQAQRAQMDQYVQSVAGGGGPAAEIEKAKALLDSGAITQAEFDAIKQKALAAS
jgi:Short C-terminal domain/Phospholipase_D-nuclease N-terminal